ncbi:hypothetical protein [Tenacibaculum sp. M341]|uniref:hypothetical protein n=1 Tax=Tenacibaculum sp. M341 TaxID=2530339 RepID=UPI00104E9486|nr:hypothetical protein [Tenacibaculum sp. M341]TCI95049.1 hypothetical protein EYW44_01620 [Tenacibaculum sp. M341]
MKYIAYISILVMFIVSCDTKPTGNAERFKYGTFEIPAGEGYSKTTIIRKDSLQIEYYTKKVTISTDSTVSEKEIKRVDTLLIGWKNNFAYTLRMKNPRTDLDKDPIFVQITKVRDSSYDFKSRIGYSKFTTPGTVYISK